MKKFKRYKVNLSYDDNFIYSYKRKVAEIDRPNNKLIVKEYYSITTSKHIIYAARYLHLRIIYDKEYHKGLPKQ